MQSVVVDDQDALWVLDPASPKTEAVVKGGPKLVKINLARNKVTQTITLGEDVGPKLSYLNDVRLDTKTGHAFNTESGTGAILVVDLKSGKARRLLANDPSTKLEPEEAIVVDGMKIIDSETGNAPAFQADGIPSKENGWLYYHALTGKTMYRIKIEYLLDESLSPVQLGTKVENLGTTPKPDGMLEGKKGIVLLTAIEEDAIARLDPQFRKDHHCHPRQASAMAGHDGVGPDGRFTSQRRRSTGCSSTTAE